MINESFEFKYEFGVRSLQADKITKQNKNKLQNQKQKNKKRAKLNKFRRIGLKNVNKRR